MKRTLPVTLTGALLLLAAQAILASLDCNELNCVWCNTPRMKKDCRIRCSQCEKSQIDDQQQPSSEDGSTKSVKSVKEPRKPAPNNYRGYATVPIWDANDRFKKCCQSNLPAPCMSMCRYDISLLEMNDRMIIKGDCGPEYMTLLLYCANDGNDNRKCCDLSLVTLNNPQCEEFCSDDPNRIGPIKSEHQDCIIQMPTIMKCHWFGLNPTSGPVTLATVATLFPPLTLAPASTIPPLITKAVLPTGSKQLIEQTKSPQNDIGEIQWTKDTDDIKWKKSTLG